MKRTAAAFVLLAGLGGCMTANKTNDMGATVARNGRALPTASMPNAPGDRVMQASASKGRESGVMRADYNDLSMPMSKDGSGIVRASSTGIVPVPAMGPYGAVAAVGGLPPHMQAPINARTSVRFGEPGEMRVTWYGPGGLNDTPLVTPFRYNFAQGGIYRLKISNIPGRAGVDLYPTVEVVPASPKSATYLAHSSVPLSFTDEDFEQVTAGNFLVKVVYLPDPQYQDLAAVAGPAEVISTRLEPGVNPVDEARRRGEVLLVVRMGNIDLDAKGTPSISAPNPYAPGAMPPMRPMPGTGPAPAVKLP
jgi:hypothetical protein